MADEGRTAPIAQADRPLGDGPGELDARDRRALPERRLGREPPAPVEVPDLGHRATGRPRDDGHPQSATRLSRLTTASGSARRDWRTSTPRCEGGSRPSGGSPPTPWPSSPGASWSSIGGRRARRREGPGLPRPFEASRPTLESVRLRRERRSRDRQRDPGDAVLHGAGSLALGRDVQRGPRERQVRRTTKRGETPVGVEKRIPCARAMSPLIKQVRRRARISRMARTIRRRSSSSRRWPRSMRAAVERHDRLEHEERRRARRHRDVQRGARMIDQSSPHAREVQHRPDPLLAELFGRPHPRTRRIGGLP